MRHRFFFAPFALQFAQALGVFSGHTLVHNFGSLLWFITPDGVEVGRTRRVEKWGGSGGREGEGSAVCTRFYTVCFHGVKGR